MLTLKQLLESDSLATIVAKLNQNLQVISNSNGGPQGIRGPQGIPGLPGKIGPLGPTGAVGPTGTILGIVPFAETLYDSSIAGPLFDNFPPYGKIGPWPISSLTWLEAYHTPAAAGEIYLDHRNNGYWKYLTAPDVDGAAYPGNTTGNPYQYAANLSFVYPHLGDGSNPPTPDPGFYAGPGWYFYPVQDSASLGIGQVWVEDYSTYTIKNLGSTGPYAQGPTGTMGAGNLKIPNARLVTKYGTVWITSGNDASASANDGTLKTSLIGKWGEGPGLDNSQPGRYSSGVDRLFFKMSIDGLSFYNNVAARGYTGPATMLSGLTEPNLLESNEFPINKDLVQYSSASDQFWVKPQYEVSIDQYTPLLFLSHRNDEDDQTKGTYGTLGIYMFTDVADDGQTEGLYPQPTEPYGHGDLNYNNVSKTLHLFTSRYAPDPLITWDPVNAPLSSNQTVNYGEMILDFRRVIASNQYVCSLPTDMKLSSDHRTGANGNYVESLGSSSLRYRTYQGFVSAINGKSLTGNGLTPYQWEYGLGDGVPYGATAGNHDTTSGTDGMLTRRTWYGTSVLSESQFNTIAPGTNDYIRNAGMLERGRRFTTTTASGGGSGATGSYFLSELVFYTSQFKVNGATASSPINDTDKDPQNNEHNSLPSLYVSPFRNIGIGTFVGATGGSDLGPLEPSAKMHVHVKENLRDSDPTFTYFANTAGTNAFATLPTKVFAAAAFSGQVVNSNRQALTDILLGNIVTTTDEKVIPTGNVVNQVTVDKFRNAVRTESWRNSTVSSMHLGAQPYAMNVTIGRNGVEAYRKEFQITLAPLNISANTATGFAANTGVGIHNLYPRARFHMYGKNTYNETEFGQELWTPGYTIAGSTSPGLGINYPFYGTAATNTNSANQVAIDYLGSTYNYPVGIYEYQYYVFNVSSLANLGSPTLTSQYSANAAVYPNRDSITPTRNAVPYGGVFNANFAFPFTSPSTVLNNSYKHGGTGNAFWDPQSYIGFNLYRDLSSANGGASTGQNTTGDNQDNTRWILGTQGATAVGHGNNGGAAIISSSHGELGIITIPRGRDGGRAYEQWEQRGLGTRDVLSHMKIVFDKNGNIAVGNAAGWDLDAYPSLDLNINTGYINYLPLSNADAVGPVSALNATSSRNRYGNVLYAGYNETSSISTAALINKKATNSEYVRLEVAAEKAWSRDGRLIQKKGFGYPPNSTITITGAALSNYIRTDFNFLPYTPTILNWVLVTDNEGRITTSRITYNVSPTPLNIWLSSPVTSSNYIAVVYPHPTEFNATGPLANLISISYIAPAGAIAAEWAGLNDMPSDFGPTIYTGNNAGGGNLFTQIYIDPVLTIDLRGSANVRLNNFVYGEGFGFSGGNNMNTFDDLTKVYVQMQRQNSPKLILSFLEKTPNAARPQTGVSPYKKVNTVIQSAQNEVSLREYWIPKTDNTGGTFMVFTDHFGKKEKDNLFQDTPIYSGTVTTGGTARRAGLHLEEVVTQEFLGGYTGIDATVITSPLIGNSDFLNNIDGRPINMSPGYVRYYNRSFNTPNVPSVFTGTQYGQIIANNPPAPPEISTGSNTFTTTGATVQTSPKNTFAWHATAVQNSGPWEFEIAGGGSTTAFGMQGVVQQCDTDSDNCNYGRDNRPLFTWFNLPEFTPCTARTVDVVEVNGGGPSGSQGANWYNSSTKQIRLPAGNYEFEVASSYLCSGTPYPTGLSSGQYSRGNNGKTVELFMTYGTPFTEFEYIASSVQHGCGTVANGPNEQRLTWPGPFPNPETGGTVTKTFSQLFTSAQDIDLLYRFGGNVIHGCSCCTGNTQSTNSVESYWNIKIRSLDAACSTEPTPGIMYLNPSNSQPSGALDTRFSTPDAEAFICPSHSAINVADTNPTNIGTLSGSAASVTQANNPAVSDNYFVRISQTPIVGDYEGVKIGINFLAKTPNGKPYYDSQNRDLVLRFMNAWTGGVNGTEDNPACTGSGVTDYSPCSFSKNASGLYTGSQLNNVNYPEAVVYAVMPGSAVPGATAGVSRYQYGGYAELYFPKDLWEQNFIQPTNQNDMYLCGAFLRKGSDYPPTPDPNIMNSNNFFVAIESSQDAWEVERLQMTFEVLRGSASATTPINTSTATSPGLTGANRVSVRRNIDHFYELFTPNTNYDNGWNTLSESTPLQNPATAIRMKRINSEFALVDFNITVKANNPWIGNQSNAAKSLVDLGTPRFTQYLRFTYTPDEAFWSESEYDLGIAQNLYGNGMWLSNWSSYKNWYPGTAIVGDDVNNTQYTASQASIGNRARYQPGTGIGPGSNLLNVTSDWSPSFYDNGLTQYVNPQNNQPFVRSWNGNILETLAFHARYRWQEMAVLRGSINFGILTDPLLNTTNTFGIANDSPGDSVFSAFGQSDNSLRNARLLFNYAEISNLNIGTYAQREELQQKQTAFVGYLGAMYALWGNQAFERNTNVQWRISPTQNFATDADIQQQPYTENTGFNLEVQFSKPILHTDTPLGASYYGLPSGTYPQQMIVQPYRYLTVSGQAIVRYARTKNQ